MNRIVSGSTNNRGFEFFTGAQHIDIVRPSGTIDFYRFNIREINDSTSTRDVRFGNNEYITNGRADDNNRIHTRTAINFNRSVLEIFIPVESSTTEQGRQIRHVIRIICILFEHEEGLEQESIIAGTTM